MSRAVSTVREAEDVEDEGSHSSRRRHGDWLYVRRERLCLKILAKTKYVYRYFLMVIPLINLGKEIFLTVEFQGYN